MSDSVQRYDLDPCDGDSGFYLADMEPDEDGEYVLWEDYATLRAEVERLREALRDQVAWWEQVPSGVDYAADADDDSPEDMTAHIAGLAIREARAALGEGE